MKQKIENGTILFKNGFKKCYEVISLTKTGVYTGHLQISNKNHKKFVDQEFIPLDQIQKILVLDKHSRVREIDFENMFKGGKK